MIAEQTMTTIDVAAKFNQLSKEGKWDEMTDLITDEIVEAFAVRGTPAQIPDLIAKRCDGLIDRVTLYTPYEMSDEVLPGIIAGIRSKPGKTVTA